MSPLLATKLHLPSVPPKRVQRPRLTQRLNEGLESGRQITLVSAPAGFGKTTCLSEWVHSLEMPVTWLSLDSADDDPGRFFPYLIAALQNVDPSLGTEIDGFLRSGQLPPAEAIGTSLVNDLLGHSQPFLLVLDDLQVIQDAFILQFLDILLSNLPQPVHLALLTREDPPLPLARLRANNQLSELRAEDLRFTSEEASRFLNEVMALSLSADDIAVLEDRTEGWIAGLQLAGLSVRDRADRSGYIAGLSGSHRYILSYLTEEVLNRQPAEVQEFLLDTAILTRLNGDLCQAVTGRADSRALLEHLYNDNLFLIPLDDEQHWYRYHHLFADLLRDRQASLQKDKTPALHRKASQWYRQAGMLDEAVQHALAAEDFTTALHLIEENAVQMLVQGYAKTVENWMQAIPAEWSAQSPRVNLAFAWMHFLRAAYPLALPYIERLQSMFATSGMEGLDPAVQAEWLSLQASLLIVQKKPTESLELSSQALSLAPEENGYVRSLAYNAQGSAYIQMDQYDLAVEVYQKAIQLGRAAGNFTTEMMGLAILIQIALQHGQYHFAFEVAQDGVKRVEQLGSQTPISAVVYGGLGQVYYQWHQLEQAHHYFQLAIQRSVMGGYSDAELGYNVIKSRLLMAEGKLDAADDEIRQAVASIKVTAPAWMLEEVVAQQIRVCLLQGRLDEAQTAFEKLMQEQPPAFQNRFTVSDLSSGRVLPESFREKIDCFSGQLYNSALRILLAQAQSRSEADKLHYGLELASHLIEGAQQGQYLPVAIETLLIRAQIQTALGDHTASLDDFTQALELGQPENFISLFIEEGTPVRTAFQTLLKQDLLEPVQKKFAENILNTFADQYASGIQPAPDQTGQTDEDTPALIDPLSRRELEILQLICEGCSNQEIAERLVLSVHTVKKHGSNIFAKLGVNSRTQAAARARQLKLL